MSGPAQKPEYWYATDAAKEFTQTFTADKKPRGKLSVFRPQRTRKFMLREGWLLYYEEDINNAKGCMDLDGARAEVSKGSKDVVVTPAVTGELGLDLSEIIITKEFLDWTPIRESHPAEEDLKSISAAEVSSAINFHAGIAHVKKQKHLYTMNLMSNQQEAMIAGTVIYNQQRQLLKELLAFIRNPANCIDKLAMHSARCGGGAHPIVQELQMNYAQLLWLQLEKDLRAENPMISEFQTVANFFIDSCKARKSTFTGGLESDVNDPTLMMKRLSQLDFVQGRDNEGLERLKEMIEYSLKKSGPNLFALATCVEVAKILMDKFQQKDEARKYAEKVVEIFDKARNKQYHPYVNLVKMSDADRRASFVADIEKYK